MKIISSLLALIVLVSCEQESQYDTTLIPVNQRQIFSKAVVFNKLESTSVIHGELALALPTLGLHFAVMRRRSVEYYDSLGNWVLALSMHDLGVKAATCEFAGWHFDTQANVSTFFLTGSAPRFVRYDHEKRIARTWHFAWAFSVGGHPVGVYSIPGMLDLFAVDDSTIAIPMQYVSDLDIEPNNGVWRTRFSMPLYALMRIQSDSDSAVYVGGLCAYSEAFKRGEYYNTWDGSAAWEAISNRLFYAFPFENIVSSYDHRNSYRVDTIAWSRDIAEMPQLPFSDVRDQGKRMLYFSTHPQYKHLRTSADGRFVYRTMIAADMEMQAKQSITRDWILFKYDSKLQRRVQYRFDGDTCSNDFLLMRDPSTFYVASPKQPGKPFELKKVELQ